MARLNATWDNFALRGFSWDHFREDAAAAGGVTIVSAGIASAEAMGTPSMSAVIAGTGIVTAEALGQPAIGIGIVSVAIPSAEALGVPVVGVTIVSAGIASAEAFGQPTVDVLAAIVGVGGIPSAEAFGSPSISVSVVSAGMATGEAFGQPAVAAGVQSTSITSAEAFGSPSITAVIVSAGIASAEAFGSPTVDVVPVVAAAQDQPLPQASGGGSEDVQKRRPNKVRSIGKIRTATRTGGLGSTFEAPRPATPGNVIQIRKSIQVEVDQNTGLTPDEEEMVMLLMAVHEKAA